MGSTGAAMDQFVRSCAQCHLMTLTACPLLVISWC
jgi:hypothetical protein